VNFSTCCPFVSFGTLVILAMLVGDVALFTLMTPWWQRYSEYTGVTLNL
jgi:hypothetical protein